MPTGSTVIVPTKFCQTIRRVRVEEVDVRI